MTVRGSEPGPVAARPGFDLHLAVTRDGSLGRSLEAALRDAVRSGRLAAGTRLPGTRSLATDLGVSRGTVVQAFGQLIGEGWLVGVPGSATRVADLSPAAAPDAGSAEPARQADPAPPQFDLRPGRADLSSFPRKAWTAAVGRALSAASPTLLDYGDPAGAYVLRDTIAKYLGRVRGVHAQAESVIITAGFTQGLALLGRALHQLGARKALTEDPGLRRHRELLQVAGLQTAPLRVDPDGADPQALPDHRALVLLTPAHQHPYGVVLAARRRATFIEWARRRGGYLIEDDYDGEFRYDRKPVSAMQTSAPDVVVYAGSASKTLAPGVRIGWLVVPSSLRAAVVDAVVDTGAAVPVIDQLALADLIGSGGYDRHVRRVRHVYRRRLEELSTRLAAPAAPAPTGVAAGLHALVPVESATRERQLVATARRRGMILHGLHSAGYWHVPGDGAPAALVVGYGTPPPHSWRRALDVFADLF